MNIAIISLSAYRMVFFCGRRLVINWQGFVKCICVYCTTTTTAQVIVSKILVAIRVQ